MITQKEIGRRLGLSRTTVSRALSGSSKIRPETKAKVLELVRETNYEKNHIGSILASNKSKKVYAFIASSRNEFYTQELKRGILTSAKENKSFGYKVNIILTDINKPELQIKKLKEILETEELDGIIITPLDKTKVANVLSNYKDKKKIVTLGISMGKEFCHIGPDHEHMGNIAGGIMSNLLRENENLLVVDNGDDHISSKRYLEGFLDRVKNNKFNIDRIRCDGIRDSIIKIEETMAEKEIKGIYINRYAHDILDAMDENKLIDKKIVTNGIGNIIQELLKKDIVTATVMDDPYVDGFECAKIMFEKIYKDKQFEEDEIISKSRIIFKENLSES